MSHKIFVIKGKFRYYYNIESKNGRILSTSQKYWSLSNCRRAARKIAHDLKARYVDWKQQ